MTETGLCECGCGELAPIAKYSDVTYGWVKGQPKRFIKGHSNSRVWNGKPVKEKAIHAWVNSHFKREGKCEECGRVGKTEYASRDHKYTRNREDYRELCRKCHMIYDFANGLRKGHPWSKRKDGGSGKDGTETKTSAIK